MRSLPSLLTASLVSCGAAGHWELGVENVAMWDDPSLIVPLPVSSKNMSPQMAGNSCKLLSKRYKRVC